MLKKKFWPQAFFSGSFMFVYNSIVLNIFNYLNSCLRHPAWQKEGGGGNIHPGPPLLKRPSVVTGLKQTYKEMQYTLYTQQNKLFFCGRTTKVGVTPSTLDLSG